MEIGHNVLHGQWDWMRDPDIHSTTWEWDFVTPAAVVEAHPQRPAPHVDQRARQGQGRGLLHPAHGPKPAVAALQPPQPAHQRLLAPFFEWGIAIYDLELEAVSEGEKSKDDLRRTSRPWAARSRRQFTKDYVATPAAAVPFGSASRRCSARSRPTRSATSGRTRSSSAATSPTATDTFTEEMIEGETRGDWYVRQMIGSANISGSKAMHLMTGNLVAPDRAPPLPGPAVATGTPRWRSQVREICERYGLPYTTGPLWKQVGSTWGKIFRLALPDRKPRAAALVG